MYGKAKEQERSFFSCLWWWANTNWDSISQKGNCTIWPQNHMQSYLYSQNLKMLMLQWNCLTMLFTLIIRFSSHIYPFILFLIFDMGNQVLDLRICPCKSLSLSLIISLAWLASRKIIQNSILDINSFPCSGAIFLFFFYVILLCSVNLSYEDILGVVWLCSINFNTIMLKSVVPYKI